MDCTHETALKAQLQHMLSLRTTHDVPVVQRESFAIALTEGLGEGWSEQDIPPELVLDWAEGNRDDGPSGTTALLMHGRAFGFYRQLIGEWKLDYHPDWLCAPPSPLWRIPAATA